MDQEPITNFAVSGEHSLEAALARNTGRRKRIAQMGIGAATLALVVTLLLVAVNQSGGVAWPWIAQATAVPDLSAEIVQVALNVNYGTLTVNGVKHDVATEGTRIRLTRKDNVVRLDAPPFAPIVCHVPYNILSAEGTGRCLINGAEDNTPLVDLTLTANDLPANLQTSLTHYIGQTFTDLAPQLTVPVAAGEHYATGFDHSGFPVVGQAQTPLVAQLIQESVDFCGQKSACQNQGFGQGAAGKYWRVDVITQLGWRFTTTSGTVVDTIDLPQVTHLLVTLQMATDGQWIAPSKEATRILQQMSSDLCDQGSFAISTAITQHLPNANTSAEIPSESSSVGGCVVQYISPTNGNFIVRLGAGLAADAGARHLAPQLPLATPVEVAAVSGS